MYSDGGQGFVVLQSTTSNGSTGIRSRLTEGSIVTTLKNTADQVVTEWGVAELRGRSIAQRARSLIAIAHPDARDSLEQEARRFGLLGYSRQLAGPFVGRSVTRRFSRSPVQSLAGSVTRPVQSLASMSRLYAW
jgi:acyl-CoA hydrolase